MTLTYPIIEVEGSAFECGFAYGQQAASMVTRSVKVYLDIFAYHTGLTRDEVLQLSARFLPAIQDHTPEMDHELRGLAEGAGLSLEEVLAVNCRTELLSTVPLHECTAMAAIPPATDPPNVLLGQTWDWVSATGELPLVLKVRQTGKPEVVSLVEAGQLGKIGMSTAGFGLCLTWLEADQRALGVPVHLLCRAMLNQNSIAEAVNLLLRVPRGAAAGFMFASGCGIALAVEATPTAIGVLEPENGLLVHTNHFLAPHLQASDRGLLCDGAGSLVRRQRALALLQPALGKIDSQTLERVQSDTECAPSSICRSGTVSPLEDNETLAGIIMDLSRMEMYVASGKPSENPYARIHS